MLNSGRIERRRGHVVLNAVALAFSKELPDASWYDALATTELEGKNRRRLDRENRRLQGRAKRMARMR